MIYKSLFRNRRDQTFRGCEGDRCRTDDLQAYLPCPGVQAPQSALAYLTTVCWNGMEGRLNAFEFRHIVSFQMTRHRGPARPLGPPVGLCAVMERSRDELVGGGVSK